MKVLTRLGLRGKGGGGIAASLGLRSFVCLLMLVRRPEKKVHKAHMYLLRKREARRGISPQGLGRRGRQQIYVLEASTYVHISPAHCKQSGTWYVCLLKYIKGIVDNICTGSKR